jgi:hypothetical protein
MKLRLLILTLCFAITMSAAAETILLPVITHGPQPGAHGSIWEAQLAITNTSDSVVEVEGLYSGCPFPGCATFYALPRTTLIAKPWGSSDMHGAFIDIDPARSRDIAVQLRIRDLSRQELTWGTEIPVVRVADYTADPVHLIDVPHRPGFRQKLRIYGADSGSAPAVRVAIYSLDQAPPYPTTAVPDEFIAEIEVPLWAVRGGFWPSGHSFGELDLQDLPQLEGRERLRLEVIPVDSSRLWAFVSITHNATQHVTIVSPGTIGAR